MVQYGFGVSSRIRMMDDGLMVLVQYIAEEGFVYGYGFLDFMGGDIKILL